MRHEPPSTLRTTLRRLRSALTRGLGPGRRATGGLTEGARFEVAYVALVSEASHNYMRELQMSILRRCGVNPGLTATPHITLKLGFSVGDLEPFERHFDQLLDKVDPVAVCLRGFDFFEEGIVFMSVEPNPELERLRRRIVGELSQRFAVRPNALEGDRYRFHATLAYGLPREELSRLRQELTAVKTEFRFHLQTLALLCDMGTHWVTYRKGTLSRTPPLLPGAENERVGHPIE